MRCFQEFSGSGFRVFRIGHPDITLGTIVDQGFSGSGLIVFGIGHPPKWLFGLSKS